MDIQKNPESAAEAIKESFREYGYSEEQLNEIAFHLTDWIADLRAFVQVLEKPTDFSAPEIRKRIIALVVHAPDHLNAATDLVMGSDYKEPEPE